MTVHSAYDWMLDATGTRFMRVYSQDASGNIAFADHLMDGAPYTSKGAVIPAVSHVPYKGRSSALVRYVKNTYTNWSPQDPLDINDIVFDTLGLSLRNSFVVRVPPGEYKAVLYVATKHMNALDTGTRLNMGLYIGRDGQSDVLGDFGMATYVRNYDDHNHAGYTLGLNAIDRRGGVDIQVTPYREAGGGNTTGRTPNQSFDEYAYLFIAEAD